MSTLNGLCSLLLPALPKTPHNEVLQGMFKIDPANGYAASEFEAGNPAEPNVIPSFALALI